MIDTYFQTESIGTAVENSSNWNVAPGSNAGMTFVSSGGAKKVSVGVANSKMVHTTRPSGPNQLAEVTFDFQQSGGSVGYTGAFVRYVDANNYVMVRSSHTGSRTMQLIERVNGSDSVLVSLSYDPFQGEASAVYVRGDSTTKGNWVGIYGSQGHDVFDSTSLPAWAALTYTSGSLSSLYGDWDTDDIRIPRLPTTGRTTKGRLASAGPVQFNLNLTDGLVHSIALYCASPVGVGQTVTIYRASDDLVLDTRTITAEQLEQGRWLVYRLRGSLRIKIEAQDGADSVLSAVCFDTDKAGGSVRIETIGRRARVWYEVHNRPVGDRPPDAAADLSRDGPENSYWGMYMEANASNNMYIRRFLAGDLPDTVIAPPLLEVSDASGYRFSTIHVVLNVIPASVQWIEWEVYPADPDDYSEAYRDTAPPGLNPRVFFVRQGYSYDVRYRFLYYNGEISEFSDYSRYKAPGSKSSQLAESLPVIVFPSIAPDYVMERQQEAKVGVMIADSGQEKMVSHEIRPRSRFRLTFENRTGDELASLMSFYNAMYGQQRVFRWTHPITGRQYAMRFASDDGSVSYTEHGQSGPIGKIEFEIEEVVIGIIGAINVDLEADDSVVNPPLHPPMPPPPPPPPGPPPPPPATRICQEVYPRLNVTFSGFPRPYTELNRTYLFTKNPYGWHHYAAWSEHTYWVLTKDGSTWQLWGRAVRVKFTKPVGSDCSSILGTYELSENIYNISGDLGAVVEVG